MKKIEEIRTAVEGGKNKGESYMLLFKLIFKPGISLIISLHEKFLQFNWLRAEI